MAQKPDSTLYQLGKYLGWISLLPSGAVAGYLIGKFAEHYVHWEGCIAVGVILGIAAALVKLVQEMLREDRSKSSGTGR
jgi:MFS family permease